MGIGDFSLDKDVEEVFREQVADAGRELAYGENVARGLEVEGELVHGVPIGRVAPLDLG